MKEPRKFKHLNPGSLFTLDTGHYQYRLKKIDAKPTNGKIKYNAVPFDGQSATNRMDLKQPLYIPERMFVK